MTQPSKPIETQFEEVTGKIKPRLTLLPYARTKHGKTWLGLSAPGPIGIISLDTNCRQIAEKYKQQNPDKRIVIKEFLRSPLSQIDDINELKKHWNAVRQAYYDLLARKDIRTIIVDTHSQMWEDCKLAWVGREQTDLSSEVDAKGNATGKQFSTKRTVPRELGDAKRDIREMINAVEDKNLVLVCRADDEWKNDPTGKGFKTGKIVKQGMPGIEYLSQCEVELFRHETMGTFVARMISSTANSDIRGRAGDMVFKPSVNGQPGKDVWQPSQDEFINDDVTFAMIATAVYPQTELEEWM